MRNRHAIKERIEENTDNYKNETKEKQKTLELIS